MAMPVASARPIDHPGAPSMPTAYAAGRVAYVNESPLSVQFVRQGSRDDGGPDDMQFFNHEVGGWDNEYVAADHLRPLDRAADQPTDQTFAVPSDVADDPAARARVYVVNSTGAALALHDQLGANHLHSLTRRWTSKP